MRRCPKCEKWLGNDLKFCPDCGTPTLGLNDQNLQKPVIKKHSGVPIPNWILWTIVACIGFLFLLFKLQSTTYIEERQHSERNLRTIRTEPTFSPAPEHASYPELSDDELWNRMIEIKSDQNKYRRDALWEKEIKGRSINICGEVQSIRASVLTEDPVVTIKTNGKQVEIVLNQSQSDKVMKLNEGDPLCVQATVQSCIHFLIDFSMDKGFIK